jgi:hypothetical protein
MNEAWRPVPGHEGYMVSDMGRVRSLDRVVTRTEPRDPVRQPLKGRVLKPALTRGCPTVNLCGRGHHVHRLVLLAFRGPRPAGMQASHLNGDRADNRACNLVWESPKDNNRRKIEHGTLLRGARHPLGRKVTCKRGHPFDAANTRRKADGCRSCRACERDRRRRYRSSFRQLAA